MLSCKRPDYINISKHGGCDGLIISWNLLEYVNRNKLTNGKGSRVNFPIFAFIQRYTEFFDSSSYP